MIIIYSECNDWTEEENFLIPPISAAASGALYQQILDGIKREISEGRLAPGSPLPSFRGIGGGTCWSASSRSSAPMKNSNETESSIGEQGLGTFVSDMGHGRSREVKKNRARELLQEAVREGSEAGLSEREIVQLLRDVIEEKGELAHVRKTQLRFAAWRNHFPNSSWGRST